MLKQILQKNALLLSVFSILIFLNCENNTKLKYLDKIPSIENYDYQEVDIEKLESTEVKAEIWYDSSTDSVIFFGDISNIIEIDLRTIWVSDIRKGRIIELNEAGIFKRNITQRGKGPDEALEPSKMFRSVIDNDTSVYFIDSSLKDIVKISLTGKEVSRISSKYIPSSLRSNNLHVRNSNSIIFSSYSDEKSIMIEIDSIGNVISESIERLVPIDKQPSTYNDIVFDLNEERDVRVFSYQGLPLVFFEHKNEKSFFNFKPDSEIGDINTPLEFLPISSNASVKNLMRDVDVDSNNIYANYKNLILKRSINSFEDFKKYNFVNKAGNEIIFHRAEITNNYIFLVNLYYNRIYKVDKKSLN